MVKYIARGQPLRCKALELRELHFLLVPSILLKSKGAPMGVRPGVRPKSRRKLPPPPAAAAAAPPGVSPRGRELHARVRALPQRVNRGKGCPTPARFALRPFRSAPARRARPRRQTGSPRRRYLGVLHQNLRSALDAVPRRRRRRNEAASKPLNRWPPDIARALLDRIVCVCVRSPACDGGVRRRRARTAPHF